MEGGPATVEARFITSLPPNLMVADTPFHIPAQARTAALSALINHLLALGESVPPQVHLILFGRPTQTI